MGTEHFLCGADAMTTNEGDMTMTKSYGANIRCVAPGCGREPFADDPVLECFELLRFNAAGEISESPAPGDWYCPEHAPAKSKRAARAVQGSPLEALGEFELVLADMTAQLVEALPHEDGDITDDVDAAFEGFSHEIAGGLHQLKEAIALHAKPVAKDKPKSRRQRKAMTARARKLVGQTDLLIEEEEPTPS
jgi:hypothetical protein